MCGALSPPNIATASERQYRVGIRQEGLYGKVFNWCAAGDLGYIAAECGLHHGLDPNTTTVPDIFGEWHSSWEIG